MIKLIFPMLLVMVLLPNLLTFGCAPSTQLGNSNTQTPTTSTPTPAEASGETTSQSVPLPSVAAVIAAVKPSVVAIDVEIQTTDAFGQPTTEMGAGSGWILSEDGYIVTNNHVVQDAQKITVTLDDGRVFPGDSVRTDALTDLAVVKIDATNLPAVKMGKSSDLVLGDWVVAIGNSLGLGTSATQGIVSALDVTLSSSGQTLLGLIQTDAAINPGNSGGPLVNMAGEVVGIDSIKISEVGIEGMGYAISIDEAEPIIQQLIDTGYVDRPWMGIGIYPVSQQVAALYNLSIDHGIMVTEVTSGSPAEAAGLEARDVITAVDSQEVDDARTLLQIITAHQIGQEIEITYYRRDAENVTTVVLAENPASSSQ